MPLLNSGRDHLATLAKGTGTAFDNANAYLGVGDSTTAFDATQTDLQASTNKVRKAMEATYPQGSSPAMVFQAVFGTSDANYAWEEWGIFNASTSGVMLNRVVENHGTKSGSESKRFTVTLTLAIGS